jgi:hypothetical protein
MISQHRWVCTICGEGFTRRTSAKRHNGNLHGGSSMIVRLLEYIVGRHNGTFGKPIDPLYFRKSNNQKPNENRAYGFTSYSHELLNDDSNPNENSYGSKIYGNQTLHQPPDNSLPSYEQRTKSTIGQGNASYPTLEKMPKLKKLAELERLLFQYYSHTDAQDVLKVINLQVFNFNDESGLNHQLKLLHDLEKKP